MSIAVSAVVRPSRLLFAMLLLMSGGAFIVGGAIATAQVGEMHGLLRALLATFSFFLGFFGFYHGGRHRKHQHIDISGTGQIRLTGVAAIGSCSGPNRPHLIKGGEVVKLLGDSTIWSRMLILRLQTESGKITTVPIMPDCVSRDSFRALSVACRWIIARSPATDSA
jgi:toxin CptA